MRHRSGRRPRAIPAHDPAEFALEVRDLRTGFHMERGVAWALDGVSLRIERGRTLGLVGESGSGKTVLSRSIMGLLDGPNIERHGQVLLDGQDLTKLTARERRAALGRSVAMVFQDPMTALNPVVKIKRQISESLRFHHGVTGAEAHELVVELLRSVRVSEPERRMNDYPHQLSGGMRQRVSIAAALVSGPRLLIADEPTTALDVTVQAQILDLLAAQQRERYMAMLLVTHDLGVVARRADDVAVMYAGQVVETGPTRTLFTDPKMPYTEALLDAIPRLDRPSHSRLSAIPSRPPDLIDRRPGCRFAPRCKYAQSLCHREAPPLVPSENPEHLVRCWLPLGEVTGAVPVALSAKPVSVEPALNGLASPGGGG